MGTSQSREEYISDSDEYDDAEDQDEEQEHQTEQYDEVSEKRQQPPKTPTAIDDLDSRLQALKLKYGSPSPSSPTPKPRNPIPSEKNAVKLYLHVGGNTPKAKWIVSEKITSYEFVKTTAVNDDDDDDDEETDNTESFWILKVGPKVRCRVSTDMQLKMFGDQRRVDFVCGGGVWAVKFSADDRYRRFVAEFQDKLFENVYGVPATEENKVKVYGKDFMGWVRPESADDSMWDADEDPTPRSTRQDLLEEFEEAAAGGGSVQSLTLGALENSFLVSDEGVQVFRNSRRGIQGRGVSIKFGSQGSKPTPPSKALLMRAETNMMLMSPSEGGAPRSNGLQQLDVETGKVVTEWRFEKDGTEVTMRDVASDSKGSQLDPSESTFLGLDDNRLCQWDTRDRRGIVQSLDSSPVLHWTQGHQFSRGTNFRCFATAGDGSIVVGSADGKIRLYSRSSMRQAKTAFPGLGSAVTNVDVTYDGKWVLGTTDTYLVLICTLFTDKDGRTKTGFSGRMGSRIPAPRLLKLTPLDSHLAGSDNRFHGGHFSWVTEEGKQERHMVATVGKFSVIWDFQQVKKSGHGCYHNQQGLKSCYCYKIVLKDESIVESRFMHDKFTLRNSPEAPLVVATPMKVTSISLPGRSSA